MFNVDVDPLQPPRPVATTVSSSSIFIEWEEVDEGPETKTYNVSWYSDTEEGFVDNIRDPSVQIDNLTSNTDYLLTVRAVNSIGSSKEPERVLATTCK